MSRPARSVSDMMKRGSFVSWFTFLVGMPLGIGILFLIREGPIESETIKRYVEHEAEQAEVLFFCCAVAALFAKILVSFKERHVQAQPLLPSWDGKPIAVGDVKQLQQALNLVWDKVGNTYLGRRVGNILNFVESRGSAHELDDQMRILADNDAMSLDSSYALMRFINWAIPILGFLGTVLGITKAISGISPERLENGLGDVTGGLTNAFDATALGLALTMISMFFNHYVERMEQGLLERVDLYVDEELAHRFVRTQAEGGLPAGHGMQLLLEKQAILLEGLEQQWSQTGTKQQDKLAGVLQQALEAALTRYGQRMVQEEKKLQEKQQILLDGMGKVAAMMKDTGREQQLALARLTDAVGKSVETVTKVQANEAQLNRLQETLSQNLVLLANSQTFEQAVQSLTAAIHLLTTRVGPGPSNGPRVLPMHKDVA